MTYKTVIIGGTGKAEDDYYMRVGGKQTYVTDSYVYRIYDPVEDLYCCGGHGDNTHGSSVWMSLGGARQAMLHMPAGIRSRLQIKKFSLTPVE